MKHLKSKINKNRVHLEVVIIWIVLIALITSYLYLEPSITGFTIAKKQFNHTDSIDLVLDSNSEYTWALANQGQLSSIRLNGHVLDKGSAKVYVENNDRRYLIFDSSGLEESLDLITGLVVLNELINQTINETTNINESLEKTIKINLKYKEDSEYDPDDDGVENLTGVVDLSVAESEFNFEADSEKICTRWEIDSLDSGGITAVCYGSENCCSLINLVPTRESWDEVFYSYYGSYGANYDNIVSAQVIYADYNLSPEEPYSDMVYSGWDNLSVKFIEENVVEFENICVESCILSNFNESSYKLIFEINNTILTIEEITYILVEEKIVNNPPVLIKNISDVLIDKNKKYSIDLSEYFSDEELLSYSYYEVEDVSVEIDDNIATIIPGIDFMGIRYLFFKANDSLLTSVSNVFKINISEGVSEREETVETERVVINRPVKWLKKVRLAEAKADLTINLTPDAENITVKKIEDGIKEKIKENKIKIKENGEIKELNEYETEKKTERLEKKEKTNLITGNVIGITGFAVKEAVDNSTEIIIEDSVEEVEIEYYTTGPVSEEEIIENNKKRIVISSDIHYEDILAYSFLDTEAKVDAVRLYWLVNNSRQEVNVDKYDTNENGLVDYVEWNVPSLSNQTYELVIEITKAEHLDSNREFIADIYEQVKAQDNNWALVNDGGYVRVTFKQSLDNTRDITLYARSNGSASVEIYTKNSDVLITQFENIDSENWYKVYLNNLNGTQDTFDLKVNGAVEFDYIVDPDDPYAIKDNGGYRTWGDGTFAETCSEYKDPSNGYTYTGDTGDGIYTIAPDGIAANGFNVTCNMTADGGGWTVLLQADGVTSNDYNLDPVWPNATFACGSTSYSCTLGYTRISSIMNNSNGPFLRVYSSDSGALFYFKANDSDDFWGTSAQREALTASEDNANFGWMMRSHYTALYGNNSDVNHSTYSNAKTNGGWSDHYAPWAWPASDNHIIVAKTNNGFYSDANNKKGVVMVKSVPNIDQNQVTFQSPTPSSGDTQQETSVEINISIIKSNLNEVKYDWNGINYTMYNDSLILMMNFDNVSSLGENNTHIVDVSRYENNGTAGGTAQVNATGKYGNALWLDGNSDYVEVIDGSSLDIGTNSMTILAWVYPRTFGSGDEIVKKDNAYILRLSGTSGAIEGYVWADTDGNLIGASTNLLNQNDWNHVAMTYNTTHQQLFVNGVADITDPQTGNVDNSAINLMIGSHQDKAQEFFDGLIDEVRIWNRSLSSDEIYQQYASNLNKYSSTQWYLYVNQSKNATAGLLDGTYSYKAYIRDIFGNNYSTVTRTITVDTPYPTWSNNKTNLTSDTTLNSSVYFNITLSETNPDKYVFSWYNGSNWLNDTATSYIDGQKIQVNKTINSSPIYWTWYINDTSGNLNQTDIWSIALHSSINISLISPTSAINASQNKTFNVIVNVTCNNQVPCGEVNVTLYSKEYVIFDNFDTGSFKEDRWTTSSSEAEGDISVRSTTAYSGSYSVIADASAANLNELITDYDFSGNNYIYLTYYWRESDDGDDTHLGSDHSGNQNADGVYFTCDGNYWYLIQNLTGGSASWTKVETDITKDPNFCATINETFKIKFTQYDNLEWPFNGIAWDDIGIRYRSGDGGITSTNSSVLPFWTNVNNPYNLTLGTMESQLVTFKVNATGAINETFEFLVYANRTSLMSDSNQTISWNVTIIEGDTTSPTWENNKTNLTSNATVGSYVYFNITLNETNPDKYIFSWYNGSNWLNDTATGYADGQEIQVNKTIVYSPIYWTWYINDTSGNLNQADIWGMDLDPSIGLSIIYPTTDINATQNEFFNVTVNITCTSLVPCGEVNVSLDPTSTTVYNFTTCTKTGNTGPSQANCDSAYTGTTLDGNVIVGGGIQNWTVPETGTYTIEAYGAQGGSNTGTLGKLGGLGAKIIGQFSLNAGETIRILVGQRIDSSNTCGGAGGGGGTFVVKGTDNTEQNILAIAGGGGGAGRGSGSNGNPGLTGTSGGISPDPVSGAAGTNGNGGGIPSVGCSGPEGAGGGGFSGSGSNNAASLGGKSFILGGAGGTGSNAGGFGGGAATNYGAGGGGGYSGGGGGGLMGECTCGAMGGSGGGGSYNLGTNQDNTNGTNSGNGYVTITYSDPTKSGLVSTVTNTTPFWTNITNPYNITLNNGDSSLITWWINASGNGNTTYEFYVYVNKTSLLRISNITTKWNVTINDSTIPSVDFVSPTIQNGTYAQNSIPVNVTSSDSHLSTIVIYLYNSSGGLITSESGTSSPTYKNFTSLNDGTYYLNATATDTAYNSNSTETRVISLDINSPQFSFLSPTPVNDTRQPENYSEINISITELNLKELAYNWNGTNYTMYNDSLVLMMNFDNVSGLGENYLNGTNFTVKDLSSYENIGNVNDSGPNWTSSGRYGGAFEFDGSRGYIHINDSGNTSLDVIEITMEAWIKPTTYGVISDRGIIINKENVWEMGLEKDTGALQTALSPCWTWNGTTVIPLNVWTYVVVSHNGSNRLHYINGNLTETYNCSGNITSNDQDLRIGARGGDSGPHSYFNGTIDEVRIWNRSLSSTEIYQQYASNLKKIDSDSWELYVNQSHNATDGLDEGNYTYSVFASDTPSHQNTSETRTIIIDWTLPVFVNLSNSTFEHHYGASYYTNATDKNDISCFAVNDTANFNISCTGYIQNTTMLGVGMYWLNITVNDTADNNDSKVMWINITDTIVPVFTEIGNITQEYKVALGYDINATDSNNVSCFQVNDTTNFKINCSGYLENNTMLSLGLHWLNITINDSIKNNNNSDVMRVNVTDTTASGIGFVSPTPANNTKQLQTSFEINVSITEEDLKEITYDWNGTNYTYYNDSLVLMFNFDNVSALGENDTYAVDVSGNGNNGTAYADAKYNISGRYGGAFEFDGVGDYVNVSDDPLDISAGEDFTFIAWVNVKDEITDNQRIFSKRDAGGVHKGYECYIDQPIGRVACNLDLGASSEGLAANADIADSLWHQVAITIEGTTASAYIDGVLNGSNTNDLIDDGYDNDVDFCLGIPIYTGAYFNGLIDEVRIWNRSLSSAEIYQQYISNLNKYDINKWSLYINQSKNTTNGLDDSTYTYQAFAKDLRLNENSTEIRTLIKDTILPVFTNISNLTTYEEDAFSFDINATDVNGISCFTVNNSNFTINCSGYLENNTFFNQSEVGLYWLNITINDTAGNQNYDLMWVNVTDKGRLGLTLITPTADMNISQNTTFLVTVNISCIDNDCGEVNASLDPENCNGGCVEIDVDGTTVTMDTNTRTDTLVWQTARANCLALGGDMANFDESYYWSVNKATSSLDIAFYSYENEAFCDSLSAEHGDSCCAKVNSGYGWHDYYNCDCQTCGTPTGSFSSGSNGGYICSWRTTIKSGLISTNMSATPFGANTTNPYNVTLNIDQSFLVTWSVNATGTINTSHIFYVFANRTSDMVISNITDTWNVTIRDTSDTIGPVFTTFANQTIEDDDALGYDIDATDSTSVDCFAVNDTANFKINCSGYLENNTNLSINLYWLNITVNDTLGNENHGLLTINVTVADLTTPSVNITYPANGSEFNYTTTSVSLNVTTTENTTCLYNINSGQNNHSMSPNSSYTGFNSEVNTSPGLSYNVSVYCTDNSGNLNNSESVSFSVNVSPSISLTVLYPTTSINVSKNTLFNVTLNVTCLTRDCGEINVSLDPTVDRTPRTCSGVWGASCLGSDPTTSSYSYDSCSAGSYYTGTGWWVDEVTVDATTVSIGDTINITCTFNCYSTSSQNDIAISYYNGTWNQIWSQDASCTDGNYSTTVAVSGSTGEQKARCQIGYTANNPSGTCFTTTWSDNDDVNFTAIEAGKTGLVSTVQNTTPFWTNQTNPYNITLNENQSSIITFWVNATGDLDIDHEFFVYTNKTGSAISISNESSHWNVTIKDLTNPSIIFNSDTTANGTRNLNNTITVNVSASDLYLDKVIINVYNSSDLINSSTSTYLYLTDLTYGTYYFNATVNDTSGNINSTATRIVDLTKPSISLSRIYPTTDINVSQKRWFNVTLNLTCLGQDCGDVNLTLDPVGIECGDITNCDFSQTGDCSNEDGTCANIPGWTYYEVADSTSGSNEQAQVSTSSNPFGDKGNWLQFRYTGFGIKNWKAYIYSDAFTANADYITYNFKGYDYDEWGYGLMIYEDGNETGNYQILESRCSYTGSWSTDNNVWGGCNDNSNTNPSPDIDQTVAIDASLKNKAIRIKAWTGDGGSGDYGEASLDDICLSDVSGTCISTSKTIISTISGTIPFWTNKSSNPFTVNLNATNSTIITFYVNATGAINKTYEFFAYATVALDTTIRNETTHWNVTITDSTLPEISFTSPTTESGNYSQNYIDASVSVIDDNVDNITIYLYNSSVQVNLTTSEASSYSVNFTSLADGTYSINATAFDTSGNSDSTETRTIGLDTIAPVINISSPVDGLNASSTSLNFTFSITDNSTSNCTLYKDVEGSISYVAAYHNSSVLPGINTTMNVSGFENRLNSWYISCVDPAGNTNTSNTRTFTLDNAAPQIVVTSPTENGSIGYTVYIRTEITDELSSVDSAWYFMYNNSDASQSLTNGTLNSTDSWDSTWNASSYENAEWNITFSVFANDTLSNTINRNISFYLDNSRPVIQLLAPTTALEYYNSNFSLNIIVQDISLNYTYYNISSLGATVQYNSTTYDPAVDGHTWQDIFNATENADGTYNLIVLGQDSVENRVNVTTSFVIDKTTPSLTLNYPSQNAYINTTSINFNWTVIDNIAATFDCNITVGSSIKKLYCINSTDCNYTFTGFSETTYDYNTSCSDNASNIINQSNNFTIDITIPLISFTGSTTSAGNKSQNYISVNASVTDQNIDNLTVNFYNSNHGLVNTSSTSGSSLFLNLTSLQEGTYYFNATVNDSAGHRNYTETRNVSLDYVYPIASISKNDSVLELGSESISINWSASDNNLKVVLFNVTLPGGNLLYNSTQSSGSINLTPSDIAGIGTYTAFLYAEDNAGNINLTNVTFAVDDTVYPSVTFVDPMYGNYSLNWIFANATSNDSSLTSITIYLYNGTTLVNQSIGASNPHTVNFTSLLDGLYYYNATACDETVCNSSETKTVMIDTAYPSISFELPTLTVGSSSSNYLLANISASDVNLDTITVYLYNSSLNLASSSSSFSSPLFYNFTDLMDGTYYMNATANDTIGNINSTETRIFLIDATIPSISYDTGTENDGVYKVRNWVYVNVTGSDLNEANITFSLYNSSLNITNNSVYTSTTRQINFTGLSDGVYYYNVTIEDDFSNRNSTSTRNITLDNANPSITITSPSNNTYTTDAELDVNYTVSDTNLNSCWYSNDSMSTNTTLANCINITTVTWNEGQHNVTIWANDSAGNVNSSSITFIANPTNPNFTAMSNQTIEYRANLAYDINATDISGVDCFTVNNTNNFSINCSGYLQNNTNLSNKIYWLNITVNDTLGGESHGLIWVNVTNTTGPTFTDISNITADYGSALAYDLDATDISGVDCFIVNNTNFNISCSGYLENSTNLNMSIYWLNITVNDTLGNNNSELIWVNVTDLTAPTINKVIITPTTGTSRTVFNITANVTDNFNVSKVVVYMQKPDENNTANITLELNNGLYNGSWSSSNKSDGTYVIDVLANDTIGNQREKENGAVIALASYSVNVSVNSSVGIRADEYVIINATEEANTWLNITTSADVNASIAIAEYSDNIALVEPTTVTELSKYIDVVVDNVTNNNISFAEIRVYYTDAEVTAANLQESTLRLYKFNENTSVWDLITPGGVDVSANYVWGNVSSFSTFGVFGDVVGATPAATTEASGGTPSTGASGSGTLPKSDFSLDNEVIIVSLLTGQGKTEKLTIENKGNTDLDVEIQKEDISRFVLISEDSFRLKVSESKTINIDFYAAETAEPGVYMGKLIVKSMGLVKVVNIIIEIKEKRALFDIKVEVPEKYQEIGPGQELKADIMMYNLGTLKPVDVALYYSIRDMEGNDIIYEHETFAVEEQKQITKSLTLPDDIEDGYYLFYARLVYHDTVVTSGALIKVTSKEEGAFPGIKDSIITTSILILLSVILLFAYTNRKQIDEVISSEKNLFNIPKVWRIDKTISSISSLYRNNKFKLASKAYQHAKTIYLEWPVKLRSKHPELRKKLIELQTKYLLESKLNKKQRKKHLERLFKRDLITEIKPKADVSKIKVIKPIVTKEYLEKQELIKKINQWKTEGYDTTILEKELKWQGKKEKIPKKGDSDKKRIIEQIEEWKAKGYDTAVLEEKLRGYESKNTFSKKTGTSKQDIIRKIEEWKAKGYNTNILEERLKKLKLESKNRKE